MRISPHKIDYLWSFVKFICEMMVKKTLIFLILAIPIFASEPLDTIKTTYGDGSLARIYTVKKGTDVREGLSMSYNAEGKLMIQVPYKDGKMEGLFLSYYPSGKIREKVNYKNDLEDGVFERFFENGKLESRELYSQGLLNGLSEKWDSLGVKRESLAYENGELEGKARLFDSKGLVKEEMDFFKGMRHGYYRKYQKGVMFQQMRFRLNRCDSGCTQ